MNNWWQDTEQRELLENRRWYEGAADRLEYYFKQEYNQFKPNQKSPYEILQQATMFWKSVGGDIPRIHSGLPRLITKTKVNLLTSNGFELTSNDETITKRVWEIIYANDFMKIWQGLEADVSWAGYGLIRLFHDIDDKLPRIERIDPASFYVLIHRGKTYGVEYITRMGESELVERMILQDGRVYIDYEYFEYDGEEKVLMPLPEIYADYLRELPFDFLPFELVNNTVNNSRFPDSPFGESDYTAVQSLFQTLDALLSHAQLEITEAKAVKFVNENVIKKNETGAGKWDKNETVIELANKEMENFDVDKQIKLFQPAIRVGEYDKLSTDLKAQILAIVGISPTSTGLPNFESIQASDKSQREREKASLRTRQQALEVRKIFLENFFIKALKYDDFMKGQKIGDYDLTCEFSEWSVPTLDDRVDTISKAVMGGVMDVKTAVAELYPDKSEDEQAKIVLNIKMEKGVALFPEDFTEAGVNKPTTEQNVSE